MGFLTSPIDHSLLFSLSWLQISMVTVALCLLLSKLLNFGSVQPQTKQVRWYKTGLPFVGTAIAFGQSPEAVLLKARKELGNVFGLNLVAKRFVVVLGSEAHRWFFNGDDGTPSRELDFEGAVEKLLGHLFGEGFMHKSPTWNEKSRRLIIQGWSTAARLTYYMDIVQSEVDRLLSSWTQKDSIDLFQECSTLNLRIMIRALMGTDILERFPGLGALYYEFERLGVLPEVIQLGWFPSATARRFKKVRSELYKTIKGIVQERYSKLEESRDRQDYLQFVLNDSPGYPDIIPTHIMALLMAGHVNTAATMAWTLIYILHNEQLKDQICVEVQSTSDPFQRSETASSRAAAGLAIAANKGELPLLDRCMRETNRLYGNLLTVRQVMKPTSVCGVNLPKGTMVVFSPYVMHWDESVYVDPATFNPNRFTRAGLEALNANKCYVPFGAGRHTCPGNKFTTIVLRSAWTTLFREYNVELVTKDIPAPDYLGAVGSPFPKSPVMVRVCKRELNANAQLPRNL